MRDESLLLDGLVAHVMYGRGSASFLDFEILTSRSTRIIIATGFSASRS